MLTNDGLANVVANLGTAKDKASATTWWVRPHTPEEFELMYRSGWLGRKIIDIPVDDATRKWRGWTGEEDFVEAIEAQEKRFGVQAKTAAAKRWARLYGSAAIIVGANPRLGDASDPLDVSKMRPGDLNYLHVEVGARLLIDTWDADIESPLFGQPRTYVYRPVVRGGLASLGAEVKIHASRVLPFAGAPLPPIFAQNTHAWGDSIFTAIEDTLNTSGTVSAVIASLLHEAKVDVIKADLSGIGNDEGEARILRRFSLANVLKSVNNTLLLGKEEDYEQRTYQFGGLSDIHIRAMQEISGAADIPVTRLLGQAPAGLQSTGESDLRNYYDAISAKQESDLRPALERLDAILCADAGITIPDGAFFTFRPLWQETTAQKAETFGKVAKATKEIAETGLIPEEALRKGLVSRLVEDGTFPALDEAMKAFEETAGELRDIPEGEDDEDDGSGTNVIPLRRAVTQDATPRTLYVSRKLKNADDLLAWARSQGFKNLMPARELHTTIAYSRTPLDWMTVGQPWTEEVKVPAGGPRMVEPIGGQGAVALLFASWDLESRHKEICEAGASWDHDGYQAHVVIAASADGVDLGNLQPYNGPLVFGPEEFSELSETVGLEVDLSRLSR